MNSDMEYAEMEANAHYRGKLADRAAELRRLVEFIRNTSDGQSQSVKMLPDELAVGCRLIEQTSVFKRAAKALE